MGERKVLNKYYPPDFDPAILPRNHKPKDMQMKVRTMLPMSICCTTCGEYLYKGKKFNAKKETIIGETYLGIEIYRFYIRCTNCSAEITFKTDPKNADYACEYGASRNFEPWRKEETENEEAKKKRKDEDADSMRALENKTIDNRQEMDILDALDELRSLKARREQMTFEEILNANIPSEEVDDDGLTSADRDYITKVFEERRQRICRLEDDVENAAKRKRDGAEDGRGEEMKKRTKAVLPTVIVKSRKLPEAPNAQERKDESTSDAKTTETEEESKSDGGPVGLSALQGYGSEASD